MRAGEPPLPGSYYFFFHGAEVGVGAGVVAQRNFLPGVDVGAGVVTPRSFLPGVGGLHQCCRTAKALTWRNAGVREAVLSGALFCAAARLRSSGGCSGEARALCCWCRPCRRQSGRSRKRRGLLWAGRMCCLRLLLRQGAVLFAPSPSGLALAGGMRAATAARRHGHGKRINFCARQECEKEEKEKRRKTKYFKT
ncbi:unnamed protein product [Phaeothamnion confervicola]